MLCHILVALMSCRSSDIACKTGLAARELDASASPSADILCRSRLQRWVVRMSEAVAAAVRPDTALARAAGLGDRSAFAAICMRYGPQLFGYALRMLNGDAGDAEDAVQEALTNAWLHIDGFRGDASLKTWLYKITAHQVLNTRRRRRPIAVDDELLEPHGGQARSTSDAQENGELWRALDAALAELPWRQRATWLLREMDGLSYAEIAQILDTTTTVVRGQLHRARATLAIRLEAWR